MGKLLRAVGAIALTLVMTGCIAPSPDATAPPTPSTTPMFASDEEALAAAEAAYARYLEVSDAIFAQGGAEPDRLRAVATGPFLDTSIAGFETVATNGWHSVGRSTFDSVELQRYDPSDPSEIVRVYLCDDVTAVDVLGPDGVSVVSADRPARTLFEVRFDLDAATGGLLVAGQEVWGDGQC